MNEKHNQNGWSTNQRIPDGSNAPYNAEQGGLVNSKAQPVARPASVNPDRDELQQLIEKCREQIQPLSDRTEVILTPTPAK